MFSYLFFVHLHIVEKDVNRLIYPLVLSYGHAQYTTPGGRAWVEVKNFPPGSVH